MNNNWPSGVGWARRIQLLDLNSLPPDTPAEDLRSIALQTDLPGGVSGDNWDVSSMQLTGILGCAATTSPTTTTVTLLDKVGTTTLPDGHVGLCRLTGSVHTCGLFYDHCARRGRLRCRRLAEYDDRDRARQPQWRRAPG